MIAVAAGVKVLVATKPVDFRKGADGLVAWSVRRWGTTRSRKRSSSSGRSGRTGLRFWRGTGPGLVLFWKRLEHGAFRWPPVSDGVMRLTAPQLAALVDGMDWSRLHARDVARPTATS